MPITFNCQQCNKQLRVSDKHAGSRAKCPQCQCIMRIPSADAIPSSADPLFAPAPAAEQPKPDTSANPFSTPATSANPFSTPATSANPYSAPTTPIKKPIAGFAGGRIVPTAVEFGDIINYSWQVWKDNLGLLFAVTLVVSVISGALRAVQEVVVGILSSQGQMEVALAAMLGIIFLSNLVTTFLGIGQVQIVLKLLRRQQASFGDLFGGGPLFLRTFGATLLFGLAAFVGFLLLFVPGILLVLFFWPFYYLVVDGKAKAIESFSMALSIAKPNVGSSLLLALVSMGIMLVGFMAFCVGILFAAPLVSTMCGAAYLMMSGQIPRNPA